MDDQRETLVAWLNDAYGVERNLMQSLQQQIDALEDWPEIHARLTQHLNETDHHATLLKQCLDELSSGPSTAKAVMGMAAGMVSAMINNMSSDQVIKNLLADYSMEHLEIASYRALIEAAEQLNEPSVRMACEEILADEEAMAEWILGHLPAVIRRELAELVGT